MLPTAVACASYHGVKQPCAHCPHFESFPCEGGTAKCVQSPGLVMRIESVQDQVLSSTPRQPPGLPLQILVVFNGLCGCRRRGGWRGHSVVDNDI